MADVFISYAREDLSFVRQLSELLRARDQDVWVDLEGIYAGEEFWPKICSAIEEADTFLFVIGPHSVASTFCRRETDHAAEHNKRIAPIVRQDVNPESLPGTVASRQWIFFREGDDSDLALQSLVRAIETDPEWVHAHTRLLVRAKEWDTKGRHSSFVLRGHDLQEAEQWLAQDGEREPKPIPLHTQFILASRKAATRRLATTLGAVIFGLIVAIVLAVIAFHQYQIAKERRKIALSRQLAAQALNHLDGRLDVTLLLSLQALRIRNTIEARSSLLTSLEYKPYLDTYLHGHTSSVKSVAFSPDGKMLVSGGYAGVVLWDMATRQPHAHPFAAHEDAVSRVAFSPDGKLLAGASEKGVILWDVASRGPLAPALTESASAITDVAFSPDGKLLAGGSDKGIMLWDVESRRPLAPSFSGNPSAITGLAFSPNGKRLASGTRQGVIIIWDVSSRQPRKLLSGQEGPVWSVTFSPDGGTLASGSGADSRIFLWDVGSGKPLGSPLDVEKAPVLSVAFSPRGKTLASGDANNQIILWDVASRQSRKTFTGHTAPVWSVAFGPDGKTLASGSEDSTVILWDLTARRRLGQPLAAKHNDAVWGVDFSPDGKTLASGSADHSVILWDVTTRQPLGQPLTGHKGPVRGVAFSPDGKTLASGGQRPDIVLWDAGTRQRLAELFRVQDLWFIPTVNSIAFSPDGKTLASGRQDDIVILWDVAARQPLGAPLTGHKAAVRSVAFSPDGSLLASGSCGKLERIRHCTQGEIRLWDRARNQPLGQPLRDHKEWVFSIAFSPDGKTLASGSHDDTIILWDVATRQPIGQPLEGHNDFVFSVAFSPEGKMLASGSRGTIILWDVKSRQPLGSLTGYGRFDEVFSVTFGPDSRLLASGGADGTVILWDVSLDSWRERACRIANRNLTPTEWEQYLGDEPYRKTCPNLPMNVVER